MSDNPKFVVVEAHKALNVAGIKVFKNVGETVESQSLASHLDSQINLRQFPHTPDAFKLWQIIHPLSGKTHRFRVLRSGQ